MPLQRMPSSSNFPRACTGYYGEGFSQVTGLIDYVRRGEGSEEAGELLQSECTCWAGACLAAKQVASGLRAPSRPGLFGCSGSALVLDLQLTSCIRLVTERGQ